MSEIRWQIYADPAKTAAAAADYIADSAARRLEQAPFFSLALSGGSTPKLMLAALRELDVNWSRVLVFQVDERVAPAADPARNLHLVHDALVATGVLPSENFLPMPVETVADSPDRAVQDYTTTLVESVGNPPVFDLIHLGLGDDGHTASLIPDRGEIERTDAEVMLTEPYQGLPRMTVSLPLINRAAQRLWLVTGAGKAAALAQLQAGDATIPAGRVCVPNSVVIADEAAAATVRELIA
ncbi:MAG: 6-phosphogluconolactonase [Pseudomonadota bacterium]